MNHQTLIEAHKGIVYLFLISLFVKTIISFINQDLFDKVRQKTKVIEMVLGTLLIVTGGTLLYSVPEYLSQGWLHVKLTLVIIGIPLAIIGLKRNKKILIIISLLIFVYAYLVAKTKSFTLSDATKTEMIVSKKV
ncbi:MAG: SirB2 family protein [Cytophagales bacterium]|nr:SirB2 family protein [Cytophagales bacterium]